MRSAAALGAAFLLATACAKGPGSPDATPQEEPSPLGATSCEDQEGGNSEVLPDFVKVETESVAGVDRVRFVFRQSQSGVTDPPKYFVSYVDELRTDGEGGPVDVEGSAFVAVSFQAIGVDLSGETPVEVYTGPKEIVTAFPTVLELEETGDFEATVSWGIGLSSKACLALRAEPNELVLEFPSA